MFDYGISFCRERQTQSTQKFISLLPFFLNLTHFIRTKLSRRLRHECSVMSALMLCWQWMIRRPCHSSDSQGLMALGWTLRQCSRYFLSSYFSSGPMKWHVNYESATTISSNFHLINKQKALLC